MQRFKGQGMFEYILLLAGILLIVVLAVVVLRGGIFQGAQKDTQTSACQAALARVSSCYTTNGAWKTDSTFGGVQLPTPIGACVSVTLGGLVFDSTGTNTTNFGCGPKPA